MGNKVKAIVEKFEQNQAKGNMDVQLAENKTTLAVQADTGVKKDPTLSQKKVPPSHLFPMGNKRSAMNPITAKSNPRPQISRNSLLTHVNVKQIAARFEGGYKKKMT